jgi:hypothetical protein
MQVLIENPYLPKLPEIEHAIRSFWSDNCLYPTDKFAMSSLFELSDLVDLSPFLFLDAKVAFLLSYLRAGESCYARNIGVLGIIAGHFQTQSKFGHAEDSRKLLQYAAEYLPADKRSFTTSEDTFDQIIVFGENTIARDLWSKLKVGGFFILASDKSPLTINLDPSEFEAFGRLWPYGMSTEFGWRFKEKEWGLENFEMAKIKKLR